MTDSRVEVLPVPKGSIVWLHNIDLGPPDQVGEAYDALLKGIGHTEAVVLCTNGDGIVDVLGPDDLVERVRAALGTGGT